MTQDEALSILKTGANVFLTGEPGSGKTHTINRYIRHLRDHGIEPAITASTGIAATHVGGMTIHSWSGIGVRAFLDKYALDKIATSEYLSRRIRAARVLIIDEVSMLSPNTVDMVDAVLREVRQNAEPFGGVQIIFVGDFFQLPPVVGRQAAPAPDMLFEEELPPRFAYQSGAWTRANLVVCYLSEQHRQDDDSFLGVLAAIRANEFEEAHLEHIQARACVPADAPKDAPRLFSHNADVDRMNERMLAAIPGAHIETYAMFSTGTDALVAALKKGCLSPETLNLKEGAAVMFTKNSPRDGYVNGTLGTVVGFAAVSRNPIVLTRDGKRIEVERTEWKIEDNGRVKAKINQLPLRLAWAMTVHKSQGMSLDEAVMDLSAVFEYGQGYVALSRVRRLDGLHILGFSRRAFEVHPEILEADRGFRERSEEAADAFGNIGDEGLKKMHDNFILAAGGVLDPAAAAAKKKKPDTRDETLRFWKEGKTVAQIAKERALTQATIFGHIEDLSARGAIAKDEILRLVSPALKKALPDIHAAFEELDTTGLTPVFERFGGAHSYDDLRIARMLLG